MPISEILWPQERVDHIGQHGVAPEEFEEVCFGLSLVLRAKATGPFPDGRGYPVTAREMTTKERRRYTAWKTRS